MSSSLPTMTEPDVSIENESQTEAASATAPPFVRYDLKSSAISSPLPMPSAMVERQLPLESWNDFWIKVQPIVRSIEFYESIFNTILIAMTIGTVFLMLAFIVIEAEGQLYNFLYWAAALILLFALFSSVSGSKRTSQLQQLRLMFRDEQDRTFASYGYALECDFEYGVILDGIGTNNTYGFRLYFLPIGLTEAGPTNTLTLSTNDSEGAVSDFQHGYLRILLYNAGSLGCCWTPFSLAYLTLFNTLPTGFESLHAWPAFWAEMSAISEKCLSSYRLQFVAQWAYLVIIVIMFTMSANGIVNDYILLLFLTAIITFFISSCRFTTFMNARSFLVQEYARRFTGQGVCMEYRTVYKFHKYLGMYGVHYLYLFPLQNGSTAVSTTPMSSSQEATSVPDTTIV